MSASALIMDGKLLRRQTPAARAAAKAMPAPAWPQPPSNGTWPPVAYDVAAYRAEAHRLRAEATAAFLLLAWRSLRGLWR